MSIKDKIVGVTQASIDRSSANGHGNSTRRTSGFLRYVTDDIREVSGHNATDAPLVVSLEVPTPH